MTFFAYMDSEDLLSSPTLSIGTYEENQEDVENETTNRLTSELESNQEETIALASHTNIPGTFKNENIAEELVVIGSPEALSYDKKAESGYIANGTEFIDYDQLAASTETMTGLWALNDTGASHHMFNDLKLFQANSIKPIDGPSKQLRLAGGGASLSVHSTGSVKLRAGDGTSFTLGECLYVPKLS
ncbi:hypothetical protein CROQUDRAFT_88008 [Cronartium quercuum f. sp. fusiforme G11]|uniref:Retrovirus-related Pol polyprotein from transposon TNT 1-94-like beta-barrel domain-containing protein n=1 Tax=Cronartium quercuum f. sp. fusiforme G11 TaxID=708437 RepID=A0A9P6TFZ8_9BASI|nr:hypothetical protein CROQUDRAFT_88008 [Cronartium quercuum f. sp. fusiforme G11]